MGQHFLTFEQAVEVTHQLIDFFNNGQGDQILERLGNRFNLTIRENFRLPMGTVMSQMLTMHETIKQPG